MSRLPAFPEPQRGTTRVCSNCQDTRPGEVAGQPHTYPCPSCKAVSSWFCHQCGDRAPGTVMYENRQLCASCKFEAMRTRAEAAGPQCAEPDCTKTAEEHVAEMRAIVSSAAFEEKFKTHRDVEQVPF